MTSSGMMPCPRDDPHAPHTWYGGVEECPGKRTIPVIDDRTTVRLNDALTEVLNELAAGNE